VCPRSAGSYSNLAASLSGGCRLNFYFVAGLKIHHQEISGLFCRFNFDERLSRVYVFDRANPTYAALYLNSENVEDVCHEKWLPKGIGNAEAKISDAKQSAPITWFWKLYFCCLVQDLFSLQDSGLSNQVEERKYAKIRGKVS